MHHFVFKALTDEDMNYYGTNYDVTGSHATGSDRDLNEKVV